MIPHPYLVRYEILKDETSSSFQVVLPSSSSTSPASQDGILPTRLHHPSLSFSFPKTQDASNLPPESDNTAYARAMRRPISKVSWIGSDESPTAPQLWLLVYALFTLAPSAKQIQIHLIQRRDSGFMDLEDPERQLLASGLAISVSPSPANTGAKATGQPILLVSQSTFYQGAGHPFRPPTSTTTSIWTPSSPCLPWSEQYTLTTAFPGPHTIHARHPVRPPKTTPGSVVYSRYIPWLDEIFYAVALDVENDSHLGLYDQWQNDPRVSKGWNEEGDLEYHRGYLKGIERDPHQIALMGGFLKVGEGADWREQGELFAYFEVYWGRVGAFSSLSLSLYTCHLCPSSTLLYFYFFPLPSFSTYQHQRS